MTLERSSKWISRRMTTNVEIYLPDRGVQVALLSIPHSDIRRLTTRPLKWMRFIMFSICGARGDLSATPHGPPLDYESISLDADRYYYKPSKQFAFVDPRTLNDQISSSARSRRSAGFRRRVMQRDGQACVITRRSGAYCDAAHLIPRSKGDEYIRRVIEIRTQCYDLQSQPQPSDLGIDAVENGMLLNKDLHAMLGLGTVAFLRTPNFAMDPTDVPRIEQGDPSRADYITLHQLKPDNYNEAQLFLDTVASGQSPSPFLGYIAGLHVDALFPAATNTQHLPPAIILDFMYGVAAYRHWKSGSLHDVINDYFSNHYERIPVPPRHHESDYLPCSEAHSEEEGDVLVNAMDEMNMVMMFFSGITPREAEKMQEKRMEEAELKAQEASRAKVMEWRETGSCL